MSDTDQVTLTDACHGLLLRLAGRVPDGLVSRGRDWLAALEPERMAGAVASHAAAARLPLGEEDVALLDWILVGAGMDTGVLHQIPVTADGDGDGAMAHVFAPAPPEVMASRGDDFGPCLDLAGRGGGDPADGASSAGLVDDVDRAAVEAVAGIAGAAALWRAWRSPADGAPWPSPRRVFLLGLAPGGPASAVPSAAPFEAAAALQAGLAAAGEPEPQVEAFTIPGDLPRYQYTARGRSALLWLPTEPEPIRLAPVYDLLGGDGVPAFDASRPRVAEADREALASALDRGTLLMSTTARLDDVLDPAGGRGRVPLNYRTDGRWVWSDAVPYYLRTHGVAPVADLADHLRSAVPPPPDAIALFRATAALTAPAGSGT